MVNRRFMGKLFDFILDRERNPGPPGVEILKRICFARLKHNKQVFIFIAGAEVTGTGEGKSYFVLNWLDHLMKEIGLDLKDYIDDLIAYTPLEYGEKLDAILNSPRLKKIPFFMVDEASEALDALEWNNFSNKAIRHINLKSRGIKPLVVFFISPDVRDMDAGVRRTLTFYAECQRPLGQSTRVVIERPFKIRRGLEDVFIDTRPIKGLIKTSKGAYMSYPTFKITMPRKEIREIYDKLQYEKKSKLTGNTLEKFIQTLKDRYEFDYKRIDLIVKRILKEPALQKYYFKWIKSRKLKKEILTVSPEFIQAFKLTKNEEEEFISRFTEAFMQNKKTGGNEHGQYVTNAVS